MSLASTTEIGSQKDRWTIGELAAELGTTTRTLRFYEAEGLVTPARQWIGPQL